LIVVVLVTEGEFFENYFTTSFAVTRGFLIGGFTWIELIFGTMVRSGQKIMKRESRCNLNDHRKLESKKTYILRTNNGDLNGCAPHNT